MNAKTVLLAFFILLGINSISQVLSGNLVISPGVHTIVYSEDMDECIVKNFQEGCDYISDTLCMLVMQKLSEVFENSNLNISFDLEPIRFDSLPFKQIGIKYSTGLGSKSGQKTSTYYIFGNYGIPLCTTNKFLVNFDTYPVVNKNYVADTRKLMPNSDYTLIFWTTWYSLGTANGINDARLFLIYDLFDSKTGKIIFEEAIFGGANLGSFIYQTYVERTQMPAFNDLVEYVSWQIAENFMKKYWKLEKEEKKRQKSVNK
jgi:hypothetical protein